MIEPRANPLGFPDTKNDQLERIARNVEAIRTAANQGLNFSQVEQKLDTLAASTNQTRLSDTTVAFTPKAGSILQVFYNGSSLNVGNGQTAGCSVYFSSDNGFTAKNRNNVAKGDSLFYNALESGFPIEQNEKIVLNYLTTEL